MSSIQDEAYDVVGPRFGNIEALPVSTTSAATDVSVLASVGGDVAACRMLRLRANGCDVYYAWSTAADTIDNTATGHAAGVCSVLPNGQFVDERPPFLKGVLCKYLIVKAASGSGALVVSVSSASRDYRLNGRS
jgi:hypothetical protein